jgi:hypothetical protein
MEIAKTFDALFDNGELEQASDMLTEDFAFSNPMWTKTKEQWKQEFAKLRNDKTTFEECQEVDGVVCRKGKKKLGLMNISLIERWNITEDGMIKGIASERAL